MFWLCKEYDQPTCCLYQSSGHESSIKLLETWKPRWRHCNKLSSSSKKWSDQEETAPLVTQFDVEWILDLGAFHKWGYSYRKIGWFMMESLIEMDDFWVPPYWEPPIRLLFSDIELPKNTRTFQRASCGILSRTRGSKKGKKQLC